MATATATVSIRRRSTSASIPSAPARCARACRRKCMRSSSAPIRQGKKLDAEIAPTVAQVIKEWAISRGVTHFTHWFQPQTGLTAEKHDAFLSLRRQAAADGVVLRRAAHSERARCLELSVRRTARHVGGARLHRVESRVARCSSSNPATRARSASRRCSSATTARRSMR